MRCKLSNFEVVQFFGPLGTSVKLRVVCCCVGRRVTMVRCYSWRKTSRRSTWSSTV